MLTDQDPHWWGPNPLVLSWLADWFTGDVKVLDVGPGHAPLELATHFVDFDPDKIKWVGEPKEVTSCDLSSEPLPFADKFFDFIYCRHVLEDMWNPFNLLREMERVGKAGYIETPSPFAELARGQDTQILKYRGYHHHEWMCWVDDGLTLVSKLPIIEFIHIDDDVVDNVLRLGPYYWNTYFWWEETIKWRHLQCPLDFDIAKDYPKIINKAILASRKSSSEFFGGIFEHAANLEG